jgi:hypothetical protein
MGWKDWQPYIVRAIGSFLAIFLTGLQTGEKPGHAAIAAGIGAASQMFPSTGSRGVVGA